ncbi:Hypothetical_protein [Hexamita inflata]|uniref:Hypothetical_protein n=1 Tax=Hexamita inflata TaxID=28002 RepID=A0AA86NKB6_9EUKA|nr:Hypothetical protein HINF_LOCUS8213 [Hexamita inflata]
MWRWSENLETQSIQDASRAILAVNTAAYYYLVQTRVVFHINYRSSPNFVCLCVFLWVRIDRQGQERSCVQGDCVLLGCLGCTQKALISQSWKVTSFSSWMFLSQRQNIKNIIHEIFINNQRGASIQNEQTENKKVKIIK